MAPSSAPFLLLGLALLHSVAGLSWWQRLAPLQPNHCPYSTEDNVCFDLLKSSTNCSYVCAYAQPLFLYPDLYDLCGFHNRIFSGYAECHFYECQKKCCKGWAMDEFGKCSIERSGIDCLSGGTPIGDFCMCTKHFTGKNCETAVCDGECLNGGECRKVDPYLPPKCICTANFTGNYCEKPVCGEGCMNGGTCMSKYYGVVCACPEGYLGPRCEQEFTPKLDSCKFVHGLYDTTCAPTCRSDRDCAKEETCCDYEGRNICVVRREKAYQTCDYDGRIPSTRLQVGQVAKDAWGQTCRCMPGYMGGSLHCGEDTCGTFDPEENTCKSHGDGIMIEDDNVDEDKIDGDQEYYPPRIRNCPNKYNRVMVEVQEHSNVGLLYHKFDAFDYLGEELYVYISQQKFFACNCSFGQRVRANATAVDRHGGKSTCCFTVQIVDNHPPKLSNCPTDIYAVVGERISWTIPKATDNVGIRDLWLEPRVSDGSRIGPGDHMFRYVAEDWHGNKAECRFLVSIKGSGSSENGWPSELKSRIQTDTSVIIGACVVGILAIALLVLMVVVFRVCRRARVFERRSLRSFRASLSHTPTNHIDESLSEPPPYEVAAKDKLPDYKPRDDPPVYDDICKDVSRENEIGGCSNPIYTISGSNESVYRAPVNPNTTVTDV